MTALQLLGERSHRVRRLSANARVLRRALADEGFPVADQEMHIVPLIVGEPSAAMRMCEEAIERGVFAQAIRPPSVPAGTSRLRLTAMASHTPAELRRAALVLGEAARASGLEPAALTPADAPEPALHEREAWTELEAWTEHEPAMSAPRPSGAPFDAGASFDAGRPFDVERDASIARAA